MPFENQYIKACKIQERILISIQSVQKYRCKWGIFFWNNFPIHLEIGTGLGNFLSWEIKTHPEINYIGMEIKWKRLYFAHQKSILNGTNFLLIKEYAQNISEIFGEDEISCTYIFFPDPWPKERQKHNRLFQELFLNSLYSITKVWWKVYIKTDDAPYFQQALYEIKKTKWKVLQESFDYEKESAVFDSSKITEFEWLWRWKNKKVCYLELCK